MSCIHFSLLFSAYFERFFQLSSHDPDDRLYLTEIARLVSFKQNVGDRLRISPNRFTLFRAEERNYSLAQYRRRILLDDMLLVDAPNLFASRDPPRSNPGTRRTNRKAFESRARSDQGSSSDRRRDQGSYRRGQ